MSSYPRLTRRGFLATTGAVGMAALAACSNDTPQSGSSGSSGPTELFWAGRPLVLGDDPFGIRRVEEEFEVTLRTISVSQGDYLTRLQALLAGGDIPDSIFVLDPDQVQRFAAQGVLGEVPRETITEHAPTLSAAIDAEWPQGWFYQNVDGRNYGLPTYYNGRWSSASIWRTDLLASVGIDGTPSTLADAEAAFAALKEAGIVGMSTSGASDFAAFHTIFGAHGAMPTAWQEIDGNLVNGAVTEGAREALALLADWYQAGYIDPEFATTESGAQWQRVVEGSVAFHDYTAFNMLNTDNPTSGINLARSTNPNAEMGFTRPLEGPGGRGAWAWGTAGNSLTFNVATSEDPERLALILGVLERIYADEDLATELVFGEEGTHYELTDAAAGLEGGVTYLGDFVDGARREEDGLGPYPYVGIVPSRLSDIAAVPDPALRDLQDEYGSDTIVDYFGKASAVPGAGTSWANLKNLKITSYTEFINGSRPISQFDDFVDEWNANGGADLQAAAEELAAQNG
ncbi:extracellular solute-binding protein [Occultella kanbiaonis]|uniref:extracellular solute-binding protein n=1 Tax=Occultella kanbiaonis TaxID=2675754 RepID=UPI00143CE161|nr:extracellular solute-binding protein [Occultella kanbiaonis]